MERQSDTLRYLDNANTQLSNIKRHDSEEYLGSVLGYETVDELEEMLARLDSIAAALQRYEDEQGPARDR